MGELVRDLLSNRYLITPPAYFILSEHYKKNFTLAELVKFARAKNTFVIDETLAKEFLGVKGILLETFTKCPPKAPVENKVASTSELPMEIDTSKGSNEISAQMTINGETTSEHSKTAEIQHQNSVQTEIMAETQ